MIERFDGEWRALSNFELRPVRVFGRTFRSNEHAYVFAKNPDAWRDEWDDLTPGKVKRLGKEVVLRPGWDDMKVEAMEEICRAKFMQHDDLRELLLQTGEAPLVEGNHWHDNFWGSCSCERCGNTGRNELGRVLMRLRERLRRGA